MRKILFILALISAILISCRFTEEMLSGEWGNITSVSSDDAEMNVAIQKAQETLPMFIKAFRSPTPTQTDFEIKARFPYGDGESAEHIWVNGLSLSGNQFTGVLGNEPIYIKNIHLGDHVVVDMKDISDWLIIDDNRLLGGFTLHIIRNGMTESERIQFDSEFGITIPDSPALP